MSEAVKETLSTLYDQAYNQGVEHCIVILKDFYGGSIYHVSEDVGKIIEKMEKLKSKDSAYLQSGL